MTTGNDAPRLYPAGDLDQAIPPGDTLRELLDERNMTQRDLATRLDMSPKHVNQLIQGLVPLSSDMAHRLELVTGTPARLWNRLEAEYRTALIRLRPGLHTSEYMEWLQNQPVRELIKRGVLPDGKVDDHSRIEQLLAFFAVANLEAWKELYGAPAVAFRKSTTLSSKAHALPAWLRMGELQAEEVVCDAYDARGLRRSLTELRALTLRDPAVFKDQIQEICARCGVAVVFVDEIQGCRASGATLHRGAKKIIILSSRYKTDDHFWFTLFHEIGHVLNHQEEKVRIDVEGAQEKDAKELEADAFASELLIPRDYVDELRTLKSKVDVVRFADKIGIAPGIVVARLQRDPQFPSWDWKDGNGLKRKIEFSKGT
ncbi:ImmA/IrrE family metallo-endopeptidase [Sphaerisporangium rubeum]|uniref:HTH-type transcriptional regulator/antitoxin HigA n=1 Tax=Sphaerisporangium rubeum TaxID=321317 RepID=A0A7X0IHW0_9ACTN|nr:ImmA/IrrE family metallo-endopeptidase [Sphaerisporangium rubeum]MBB6475471.1 HTH-type transcriptional regulator/antitoxin HigA [Sphaerisporangium rubeum]